MSLSRILVISAVAIAGLVLAPRSPRQEPAWIVAGGDSLKVVSVRSFSAREEAGWDDRGDRLFTIGIDSTAPVSPPLVGVAKFPRGFASGSGPINTSYDLTGERITTVYLSLWIRFSDRWIGNDAGINKVLYLWHHGKPAVALVAVGRGRGPLRLQVRLQDLPQGARNLEPRRGRGTVSRGAWQRWDFLLTAGAPGSATGTARWWVDGEEAGFYDDILLTSAGDSPYWERVAWNPTYGGKGPPVPADQTMMIDHMIIAVR